MGQKPSLYKARIKKQKSKKQYKNHLLLFVSANLYAAISKWSCLGFAYEKDEYRIVTSGFRLPKHLQTEKLLSNVLFIIQLSHLLQ